MDCKIREAPKFDDFFLEGGGVILNLNLNLLLEICNTVCQIDGVGVSNAVWSISENPSNLGALSFPSFLDA